MDKLKKATYIGVCIAVYLVLAYVFLKYALGIILPFAISFIIVVLSRPIVDKISKYTRVPRSVISLFVIGVILTLGVYLLALAVGAMLEQAGNILTMVSDHLSAEDNYVARAIAFIESFFEKFPFLKNDIAEDTSIYTVALEMAKNAVSELSGGVTRALGELIAKLPELIITIVVILLSLFYFSKDYQRITKALLEHMPQPIKKSLPSVKRDVLFVLSSYLRSYLILLLVTFAEVFAGLLILGIENAFTISIVIALVDLLPILGVGTVLVPWALLSLVTGNTSLAIGLIILFGVVYIVRQIIEPRIVSSQMNVHPLIAILAMYAGLKIAGIGGMIVAPLLAFITKTIYDGLKKEKSIEKAEKL